MLRSEPVTRNMAWTQAPRIQLFCGPRLGPTLSSLHDQPRPIRSSVVKRRFLESLATLGECASAGSLPRTTYRRSGPEQEHTLPITNKKWVSDVLNSGKPTMLFLLTKCEPRIRSSLQRHRRKNWLPFYFLNTRNTLLILLISHFLSLFALW